ncbi:MAG: prepilin-type N-terminal cleavage/methylation domain-containing protein, partial [Rhodocyclaceae bacterium]|nr:prepilin-type N-terminal cleavage/methylation domain-containing protein [Rhodocyclaceae bacterium]
MSRRPAGSNKLTRAFKRRLAERGISLLETLIAMALGLMVMAGVLQFVSRLVEGNTTTLKVTRLEQDIRTLMDIMLQDIRRAGHFPEGVADLGAPIQFMQDQPPPPMIDGQPLRDGLVGSTL